MSHLNKLGSRHHSSLDWGVVMAEGRRRIEDRVLDYAEGRKRHDPTLVSGVVLFGIGALMFLGGITILNLPFFLISASLGVSAAKKGVGPSATLLIVASLFAVLFCLAQCPLVSP